MKLYHQHCILIVVLVLSQFTSNAQEIGLQLYSLREQFKVNVPNTLKIIKDYGITTVEGGDSYGLPVKEFQDLLKENNLSVVSVGASFEELQNTPELAIERAKSYGATFVVCFWIPHNEDVFTSKETELAISVFNKAGELLADKGLSLAYHPHGYEFRPYQDGTLFDFMAKNATHFNFEMDVFWIKHAGVDPLTLLKKYPKKFPLMHLKDRAYGIEGNQNGKVDVEKNVTLGLGDVGIKELVAEAKKLGIKYLFIEDESSSSVEQISKSLTFLRGLK